MPARSVIKAAAVVLTGGVAAWLLAACSVNVGALQYRTRSYQVPGQVQALVVNARVGGVQVTGGNVTRISVTEHISYRGTVPVTTHRTAAGTLTLGSTCPQLETCSVGYVIRVPRPLTVRVSDKVGTVRLQSLSGQVTVHSSVGDIDLGSLSGPVEATGSTGTIHGQGVSSARATLRMSAGTIDVTFSAAPAAITATTTAGSVTLRVPGSVPYAVDASSSVGSTQISVPRSPASPHAITARVTTGSITIEPAP